MKKITAYLTKDQTGVIELWNGEPEYDRETGFWFPGIHDEVSTEIIDGKFLDNVLKEGQCVEIKIEINKIIYDYDNTPEGKLMKAIYGK
ncbi:MAG: hypothetical protein J6M39_06650 [Lachnospiraceae bacterium]|nr:hypothetical protein [Lachnospiraceae bacterium]